MKKLAILTASMLAISLPTAQTARADNDALIQNAMSAAPAAVAKDASVMISDGKGGMMMAKTGTNGFTCMPDDPATPTNDPMCLDGNSMLWVQAYLNHTAPPDGKVGISYMLQGDSVASNTDPYATAPAAGGKWLTDGPHMMIFNAKILAESYPHTGDNPDTSQPYIMFPGTPYAHLMIPVTP